MIDARVGSYEIVRSLASGGMAEVLLARQLGPAGFTKLVVIKRMLPELADDPRYARQFLDEARLMACLGHPGIVQIHDIGKLEGEYCITMEYVHGRDLRSVMRRCDERGAAFPLAVAVQIARDVAAALHHAHERRDLSGAPLHVVHRDVSPSNILVSFDGAVKLTDFGIAKAATSSIRTQTGTIKGTAGYMSPEQIRGRAADRRSDVFALGVVLWELVTGQSFHADVELAEMLHRVAGPPSSVRRDCPRALDEIVLCALAPEPACRYQSAEDVVIALETLAHERQLSLSPRTVAGFMAALFDDAVQPAQVEPAIETKPDNVVFDDDQEPAEPTIPAGRARDSEEPTRLLERSELRRLLGDVVTTQVVAVGRSVGRTARRLALAVGVLLLVALGLALIDNTSPATVSSDTPSSEPVVAPTPAPVPVPAAPAPPPAKRVVHPSKAHHRHDQGTPNK